MASWRKPLSGLGDARFLLAAIAFHVIALPVAAAIAPEVAPTRWFAGSAEPYEYDVDLDSALLPPEPDDRVLPIGPPQHVIGAHREHTPRTPYDPSIPPEDRAHSDTDPPPDDPGEILTADPDAPGVTDEYTRPPSAGELYGPPGLPALGGGNEVWRHYPGALPDSTSTALPAPTKAPARKYDKKAATKVLQDGVREKERKLGLDFPGRGPIRSAFVTAVYSSDAPYVCEASFSLSVDKSGKVTGVSLLGFSGGDSSTWNTVVQTAKGALASAKLPMKSAYEKGAVVGVTVRSIERTPAGGVQRDGLKINFDPSDIGAKATRMVTAHVNPQPVQ